MAFYSLEPFGEYKADWRIGQLCALMANLFRAKKKDGSIYKTADFMPEGVEAKPGWQQMLSQIEALNRGMGGKDLRQE